MEMVTQGFAPWPLHVIALRVLLWRDVGRWVAHELAALRPLQPPLMTPHPLEIKCLNSVARFPLGVIKTPLRTGSDPCDEMMGFPILPQRHPCDDILNSASFAI